MPLEVLDLTLVLLGGRACTEGTQISAPLRLWVSLAAIQTILAGA
jgi:hypothetical protein